MGVSLPAPDADALHPPRAQLNDFASCARKDRRIWEEAGGVGRCAGEEGSFRDLNNDVND